MKKKNKKKKYNKKTAINRKQIVFLAILLTLTFYLIYYNISNTSKSCTIQDDLINEQVMSFKPDIEKEMKKQGVHYSHLNHILALLMQESKGQGTDPFQASESKCGKIGCIDDRNESIEAGIKAYKGRIKRIRKARLKETPQLVLQSYNYGPGYIDYLVRTKQKGYTPRNAIAFSKLSCGTAGTNVETAVNEDTSACYGDYKYVEHVEKYLDCNNKSNR